MPSASKRRPGSRYDRLSRADLTMLLTDRGEVPMNTGAVLLFGGGDEGAREGEVWDLLADRVATVQRLRQRLHRPPPGGGRPIWVDAPNFRAEDHLERWGLRRSTGLPGLLDLAAALVCERLTPERPPWRACIVTDPATGRVRALVLVVHHVLTDGLGALAVLSALADPGLPTPIGRPPRPRPSYQALALDAARQRVQGVADLPARLRGAQAGLKELGGAVRGHHLRAGATSLTGRTSGRRRLSTVEISLTEVASTAHAADGTVNDVVLAAVGGALMRLLAQRGERPPSLVVSVPVSGRAAADLDHLGNRTGVRPVRIPLIADDRARLHAVAGITRAAAGAPRASSSGPLGVAFRLLARLGLFAWFVDHQRLVDTFETNLRGPVERLSIGGSPVRAVIPVAVNPGNVGVSFDVLSYAGTLGITIVADPDVVPDLDALTRFLSHTLARLCAPQNSGVAGR